MLLWKIKDFFTTKWFIVIVRTFFLLLELETEIDSLEKEIKYKGTGESMFCSKGAVINYWGGRVGIISKVRAQKC